MHCSYNHSALLEFDFDPLKAGAKKTPAGYSAGHPRFAGHRHADALRSDRPDSPRPWGPVSSRYREEITVSLPHLLTKEKKKKKNTGKSVKGTKQMAASIF